MAAGGTVFVTVGTTKFEQLVHAVLDHDFLNALREKGYSGLVVQTGSGSYLPPPVPKGFHLECYSYKSSLHDDLHKSSLVICHGGAGSILEALDAGKHVIVAINESLMGNHQTELAEQLAKDKHLVHTTPKNLLKTVREFDSSQLARYIPGEPKRFGSFLDKMMSFKEPELQ